MSFNLPAINATNVNTAGLNFVDKNGDIVGSINVLDDKIVAYNIDLQANALQAGPGISLTPVNNGNNTVISNTGVIEVLAGRGIEVYNTESGGVMVVNTGSGSITQINGGAGISAQEEIDGSYTITNTGILGATGTDGVTVSSDNGYLTISTNSSLLSGITGGTGISVDNQNGTVTVTNIANQIYTDNWFITNLASKPPAPTYNVDIIPIQTQSQIGFAVKNPTFSPFGSMLVPYINSISIKVGDTEQLAVLNNNATYIPSGSSPIQGIILNKLSDTASTYEDVTWNVTGGGSTGLPTYTYFNTALDSYISSNQITVTIWFDNSNVPGTSYNKLVVPLPVFLQAFPPSAPTSIQYSSTTPSSAVVSWRIPDYTSYDPIGNTGNNSAFISDYQLTYTYQNSPSRYLQSSGIPPFTGTVNTSNTGYTLTSLYPGARYLVAIGASNNLPNTGYGVTGFINVPTSIPNQPSVPNLNINLPASNYYNNIKKVSNNSTVSQPVYNIIQNPNTQLCTTINNIPANDKYNPGITGNVGSSTVSIYNLGVKQQDIILGGFENFNTFTYNVYPGNTGIGLTGGNASDFYASSSNATKNFYKVVPITPTLTLGNYSPGTTGSIYLGYLNGANNISSNGTPVSFYTDTLNTTPAITSFNLVNSTASTITITGITVTGGTGSFNYGVTGSNFGRYFYRGDKIVDISSPSFGTVTGSAITNLPTDLTPPLSSGGFTGSFNISYNNSTYLAPLPFTANLYSYYTTSGSFVSSTQNYNVLLDTYSYNKTFAASRNNTPGGNLGFRITSTDWIFTSNPSPYTVTETDYNNSTSLVTIYTNDLPIIQGRYATRTPTDNATYLTNAQIYGSATNYSNLITETGFRFVTFSWILDTTVSSTLTKLRFAFTNFSNNGNLVRNGGTNSLDSSTVQTYYRLIQYNSNVAQAPNGGANNSTYWINANTSFNQNNFSTYIYSSSQNGTIGGINYSNLTTPFNDPTSTSFTYEVITPSITPNSLETGVTLRVNFCIGFAMNANVSFDSVSCTWV